MGRRRSSTPGLLLLLELRDEFRHRGIGLDRLHEQNVLGVDDHAVRGVRLLAAPDQSAYRLLFRTQLSLNVIDLGEHGVRRAETGQPSEEHLAVRQKNGLVGSIDGRARAAPLPPASENYRPDYD